MATTVTNELTYRPACVEDIPGLVRLWEEASGWGAITEETWRSWFLDLPWGPSLVVVGVDGEGEIAAQEVFTPVRLIVGPQEASALRISAPILRHDLRSRRLRDRRHPIVRMLDLGLELAEENGAEVVYAMPEPSWRSFFRWYGRFHYGHFPCVAREFTPHGIDVHKRLEVRPLARFSDGEDLLSSARGSLGPDAVAVVRSPAWLNYKNGSHLVLAVRENHSGDLAGYAAVERATGLIADILARNPEALEDVLSAVLARLGAGRSELAPQVGHLKLLRSPPLAHAADRLGFVGTGYSFLFVCLSLADSVPMERLTPDRWYLAAKD